MKPNEMATLPLQLEKQFYELQDRIMSDVVRRLRKTGGITSTADYQLNKILMLGGTTEFIESEIKRLAGLTDAQLWEIYDTVIEKDYTRMRSIYEQVNGNFIPYEENHVLKQWADAVVRQTKGDLKNITGSLGFQISIGGGRKAFTPLADYYQKYLDRACLDVVTGSFDYNTVLRRVVREMTASGLQTVDYASGYSSRAPVAARRAVLTGVHQLTAKMNEAVAKDLETEYFEVTAHAGARPSHAVWQGRVYKYQDLEDVCGLGEVTGLCGANCRHSYYAFIPGVSVRAYPDEYLEELREEDERIRTFSGREYNGYTATQRQRQYETTMRSQRANIRQLKEGGAVAEDIQAAQARYLNTLHEYQRFSRAMNLEPQMERVYMDGLGRMAGGRIPAKAASSRVKAVEKTVDSGILKLSHREQEALNRYFSFESYGLNDRLRRGALTEIDLGMIGYLDSALEKMPKYKGTLSRSIYFGNTELACGYADRFEVGKEIRESQYISTKRTDGLYNPDGDVQIYILESKNGRDLTGIKDDEGEVLFPRGARFETIWKEKKNGSHRIYLREV